MNDDIEIDDDDHEEQPDPVAPPPLPFVPSPTAAELSDREQMIAIRAELSRVNTTAERTPDAFVSWLRSQL